MLGVSIVAAIVALVLVLQLTGGFSANEPAASPTPSAQDQGKSPQPVATGGTAIPFEGNGTGVFEILSQTWSEAGLVVDYRVTLDEGQGERSFSLYMFTNATLEVADPIDQEFITATSGEPFTGSVEFAVDQAAGTLVLASGFGAALTALPIPQ
ncbi:hypothetical protein [Tessaracoccus sp.]